MDKQLLKKLQEQATKLRAEGKYKESIEISYELLEKGTDAGDYKSILTAHICKATSFYSLGEIEEAFHSMDAYMDICHEHGNETDFLNLYNISFLLYEFKKDFIKAKETLFKSIKLGEKLGHYNIMSNGYSNLSHVHLMERDYIKAIEMAELGLQMAGMHKPESLILELRVKLNLAKGYIGIADFDAAKALIDDMLSIAVLDSFPREKSQCYDLLGAWYSAQGYYKEAFEAYSIAKQYVESYNDVYLLKTIQEERMKLCDLMNDVPAAYNVQKEYIELLREISDRELAMTALKLDIKHNISAMKRKANIDFLTGTYNRRYIENTANDWLAEAAAMKDNIICIAFDIDNFKSFNDRFGHLFGDAVIKQVGRACRDLLGEEELAGRYGGDEFIILMKGASLEQGENRAIQLENRIRAMKIVNEEKPVCVQISIGVAQSRNGMITTFSELFQLADTALYEAKENGKNQICIKS